MRHRTLQPPYRVVTTENIAWGNPRLDGTHISAAGLAGRFAAGDSVQAIADDFALPVEAVEATLRAVLAAAFTRRGLMRAVRRRLVAATTTP